ncbi:hypothetical protein [Lysinibacillus sp. ZYM-1]|uniref:hypothetical protein n=1 Tax=Lysinibacillus sp. ZYM-1 TaxID=1681184 RepID=UPI0006CE9FDE|nr:hypothetical protein [Lysinibacillus sp. ZYM-1]KPN94839.1 hypothetical protein AO843_04910 [Lysinibacillus sp. ZYM-1]
MDKHTMRALQDVSTHKEAIIQKVLHQMQQESYPSKPKWTYRAVTIMITCSILLFIAWQAAQPIDQVATEVNEGEKLPFTDLFQTEVEGKNTTFSQFFPIANYLSQAKNIKYYAPLQGFEAMQSVATSLGNAVHLTNSEDLPFKPNIQEVYAVTSKMDDGSQQTQFQFSFKEKSYTGVDLQYINFTVTNVDRNPLADYVKSQNIEDTLGIKVSNVELNFMNPLLFREMTPDRDFTYIYYNYDEAEKRIYQMNTRANEFYSYYNGYVYHIGYQLDGVSQEVQEKMANIVRGFILGN